VVDRLRRQAAIEALRRRREPRLSSELLRWQCLGTLIGLAVLVLVGILALLCLAAGLWGMSKSLPITPTPTPWW